jgi:predicted O-methyltransferase YrrM
MKRRPIDPIAQGVARACRGFLDESEGLRLYELAHDHAPLGPILEIGSYCGKSSVYLGDGARAAGGSVICLDHHRGSEEHQPGEGFHEPDLFDAGVGRMDSLPALRRTVHDAGLEDTVILMVTTSPHASRVWSTPLGMVFIDGGHSFAAAEADYAGWASKVAPGGILAIHDLFPDPNEGGQAPITIYRRALSSGDFDELPPTKTLGVLRRRAA